MLQTDIEREPRARLSRSNSLTISRHASLTRSRPPLRSRSRPGSTYSDTDLDYSDNLNSAVSGHTLAQALHSSFFLSTTPSSSSPPSAHPRARGHLARQDSATLPRGELPYAFTRKSFVRSSKGSLASSTTGSIYPKSADEDVPPVPPIPDGLSPEASPYPIASQPQSRRPSAIASDSERLSSGLTAEWRRSNGPRRAAEPLDSPDRKRPRIAKVAETSVSQRNLASSILGLNPTSYPDVQDITGHTSNDDKPPQAGSFRRLPLPPAAALHNIPSTVHSSSTVTSSNDTPGYDTPLLSDSQSAMSTESMSYLNSVSHGTNTYLGTKSPRTPPTGINIRASTTRSFSESSPRQSVTGPRPSLGLLPIGERPRSSSVQSPSPTKSPNDDGARPYSLMSPLQPPTMPAASKDTPESPDLLDIMFAGSRVVKKSNGATGMRVLSPPAPITVPPPSTPDYGLEEVDGTFPYTDSAVQQTFPETPYAFTPYTAGFDGQQLPQVPPPPMPRTTTIGRIRQPKSEFKKGALVRCVTMAHLSNPPSATDAPMTPPLSGNDSQYPRAEGIAPVPPSASGLSAIEEGSIPASPSSRASTYSTSPEHSPAPTSRTSATGQSVDVHAITSYRPTSLVPSKRSLTPLPSPPESAIPLPPSHLPSPLSLPAHPDSRNIAFSKRDSKISKMSPLPSPVHATANIRQIASPPPSPGILLVPVSTNAHSIKVELLKPELPSSVDGSPARRFPRSRPPPPTGPRKPSNPLSLLGGRSRAGSVASSAGSPPGVSGSSGVLLPGGLATPNVSATSPRFQTTPVKFRGLKMEEAQWTFSSEELQSLVSSAIKKSAEVSSIRLLPLETLTQKIPAEMSRLQTQSTEIRTNYQLAVRKRKKLLGSLRSIAEGGELTDHAASVRLLDDVSELSEYIDLLSEELYNVTDQLSQLTHLQDVHFGSALAMGLRKLNNSFVKHLAEKDFLRKQVQILEDERNEAWMIAQDAARDLDDFNDKMAMSEGVLTPADSRRSSRISIARKASLRKLGMRSPSRLRSQRSSMASRSSMALAMSPAARNIGASEIIPPVPPIPSRVPLGISTADLPDRTSGEKSPRLELIHVLTHY